MQRNVMAAASGRYINTGRNWQHHLWAVLRFQVWIAENPASTPSLNDRLYPIVAVRSL
jgi:hypothetical protein